MDPTPYLRFSTVTPPHIPPAGFVDFYYDMTLGRFASLGSDGIINSPDVPPASPTNWGTIVGTLSAQADLAAALAGKSDIAHTHTFASLTSKPTTKAGYGITDVPSGSGTSTGTNTGDQTTITGNAGTVTTIAGQVTAGTGIAITGSGTVAAPYVVATAGVMTGLRSHDTEDDTIGIDDRYVRSTGSGDVVQRIPNDSVVDFPIGTRITFRQAGTGDVTLVPGAGVDLNGQVTTSGRNRTLGIIKVGPNEWDTERGAF